MKVCPSCKHSFEGRFICPHCYSRPPILNDFIAFAPELAEVSEGFEADFFHQLVELEATSFWFRSRNLLILWALSKYFNQANKFLEIGCGTGFVLSGIEQKFPYLDLYGSEIFTAGLSYAAHRLNQAQLFQMDARNIPFLEEFDVIAAFDVLEHIQEDVIVLQQMYKATKYGGGIILTVPQHPWLWSQADDYAHHVRRYRSKELKEKIRKAGFQCIRTASFVSLILPLMIISRILNRQHREDFDPTQEHQVSGLLNIVLEKVLTFERRIIRLGFSFPAGGSLLLIAQKPYC